METQQTASPSKDANASGTLSGAERLDLYEREGVFETFAYLNDIIGPGKQYADSTEYLHAMRARQAQSEHA